MAAELLGGGNRSKFSSMKDGWNPGTFSQMSWYYTQSLKAEF